MRRGSLIGPLVLIGIGAAFLIRNVWPEIPILDFLARNWPYILIAWGGLRLIELFVWQSSGKPLPVSGVSGGEWTLVVFLCLFGMMLFQFSQRDTWWNPARIRVGGWEVLGDSFDFNYQPKAVKASSKTPRVIIESFRGDAQISGTDGDEVKVQGRKSVRAMENAEADRADKESPLEVVTQGDQVIIRCNQDRADSRSRVTSRLEILVPRGASIDARGRYGDFDIRDVNGAVEIYSDNAGVRLDNIGGNVRVDLRKSDIIRAIGVKGDLELKGRGDDIELENIQGTVIVNGGYSGTVSMRNLAKPVRYEGVNASFQMEKVNGEIRSTISNLMASNVVGPIRVNASKTKDVEITDFTQSLEVTLDRGDVTLRPGRVPLAKMQVSTKNGEIDLAIPDQAKFEIRATANRGEVRNDWGSVLRVEGEERRGQTLSGTVGSVGGSLVTLQTNRGNISVRKGEVFTTTPAQPPSPTNPPAPPSAPAKPVVRVE
jgi:DUF4097 and DUF4098 domain-containing protein YvlB